MKWIKGLLSVLLVLFIVLAVAGFFLPERTHVERSVYIATRPEAVFAYVNDFRKFNQWSPWAARDPNTQYQFEGPEAGAGAKMYWQSDNPQVGSGNQEIIESIANELVRVKLDFGQQGAADAYYVLVPENQGTKLTWGLDIEHGMNLVSRYFGLFFDDLIGPDYETGLGNLKSRLEAG